MEESPLTDEVNPTTNAPIDAAFKLSDFITNNKDRTHPFSLNRC